MNDFQPAAVGFHAKDRSSILVIKVASVGGFEVVSAVADCEVDTAVWPKGKTIEVVATEADANTVAFLK